MGNNHSPTVMEIQNSVTVQTQTNAKGEVNGKSDRG